MSPAPDPLAEARAILKEADESVTWRNLKPPALIQVPVLRALVERVERAEALADAVDECARAVRRPARRPPTEGANVSEREERAKEAARECLRMFEFSEQRLAWPYEPYKLRPFIASALERHARSEVARALERAARVAENYCPTEAIRTPVAAAIRAMLQEPEETT